MTLKKMGFQTRGLIKGRDCPCYYFNNVMLFGKGWEEGNISEDSFCDEFCVEFIKGVTTSKKKNLPRTHHNSQTSHNTWITSESFPSFFFKQMEWWTFMGCNSLCFFLSLTLFLNNHQINTKGVCLFIFLYRNYSRF